MANSYESLYTGLHNDGYEPRIKTLEDQTLNERITALESSNLSLQAALTTATYRIQQLENDLPNYLPLSGGVLTDDLVILGDLKLRGTEAKPDDSGDIIYQTYTEVEKGRIWTSNSGAQLYYRPNETTASLIINNGSMVPGSSTVAITRTLTSSPGNTWKAYMNAWTAPANGYVGVYFTGCSNSPSFTLSNGVMSYRGNGNGGRDVQALLPVAKGQSVSGECVYCYPAWITFYYAKEGQ